MPLNGLPSTYYLKPDIRMEMFLVVVEIRDEVTYQFLSYDQVTTKLSVLHRCEKKLVYGPDGTFAIVREFMIERIAKDVLLCKDKMERGFLSSGRRGVKQKTGTNVVSKAVNKDNDNMENKGNETMASVANNDTTVGPNPAAPGMSTSYANVTGEPSRKALNFRTLFTPAGNMIYMVVPVESIRAISERFANTAYGFFLEKRVAYLVVANYVKNTWGKYGLVKSMLNSSTDIFSFQFRSSYAKALIKIQADVELKDNIVDECPKNIDVGMLNNLKKPSQAPRGNPVGPKMRFKPVKQVYRQVYKKNNVNTSSNKKKDVEPTIEVSNSNTFDVLNSVENDVNLESSSTRTTLVIEKIDKMKRLIIDEKLTLVDDEGKPLKKVDSLGDHDSEDEFA
ncbi:hypothetical protein Tco_0909217 [Tanacetum coccineum]|uniref:Uncharacterized protein n=1 Tax=Tanacetum coccineum TaxID=301880 RepID=A0ABQ5CRE4_9ASTR